MNICSQLRLLAGIMVLITLVLAHFVSSWWLLLGVAVALNLIQSAFTRTCPAVYVLRKLGAKGDL